MYKHRKAINAELIEKLARCLHLYPLPWLLEKGVFNTNIVRSMQVIKNRALRSQGWAKPLLINRTRRLLVAGKEIHESVL